MKSAKLKYHHFNIEADAVKKLINHIDDEFETIVNAILACNGRVIVTGMGKCFRHRLEGKRN